MKKILLLLVLVLSINSNVRAEELNKINRANLRNLNIVNSDNSIDYSVDEIKYHHYIDGPVNFLEKLPDIKNIPITITTYKENKKKINQYFYNAPIIKSGSNYEIILSQENLPLKAQFYTIKPQKIRNYNYYEIIKKRFLTMNAGLNQALVLSYALYEINQDFNTTIGLINNNQGIKSRFNIQEEYPNGFMLTNNIQIFINQLNSTCKYLDIEESKPSKGTACAELIIDINGNELPNLESDLHNINDRFSLLLYPNTILPLEDSIEKAIIEEKPINAVISNMLINNLKREYNNVLKGININNESRNYIEIYALNKDNNRKISKISFESKLYDKKDQLINKYSQDVNNEIVEDFFGRKEYNDDIFVLTSLFIPKNTKYFDIVITNKKKNK